MLFRAHRLIRVLVHDVVTVETGRLAAFSLLRGRIAEDEHACRHHFIRQLKQLLDRFVLLDDIADIAAADAE